jgi:hypothetical protein
MPSSSGAVMDNEVAELLSELKAYSDKRHNELKDYADKRHNELKDYLEKRHCTKVDLLIFREEVAIQFGQVHVEIAKLESTLIKWFIATAVAIAGMSFAIARYVN